MTESAGAGPVRLLLSGPTGIGKTALAVELAQRFPIEIISADSMQIYRGLEIGTAQPTPGERARAVFHGCGELPPDARYDVHQFLERCAAYDAEIRARGRMPVYVGGTGLYLRALRWGMIEQPCTDPALRRTLESEIVAHGPAALHARLAELDPAAARRIDPRDAIRIVRALEIVQLTGTPLATTQAQWQRPVMRFPHRLVVLTAPRGWLRERIARRTAAMLEAGWIDEVAALRTAGHPATLHCFKALGYREIFTYLEQGGSREALREAVVTATHQFAKRQMIWFRRERPALWLRLDPAQADPFAAPRAALENLLAKLQASSL